MRHLPSPEQKSQFLKATFEQRRQTFEELTRSRDVIAAAEMKYPVEINYPWCRFVTLGPGSIDHLLKWIESTLQETVQKTIGPYR